MIHKLEADSIVLEFGGKRILSDIYLQCETGNITGMLGRNGQGKTCLMNVVYGTLDANSKSVRIDNISLPHAYSRADLLVYLPQFNFIPGGISLQRIFSDFNLEYSGFEQCFPEFKPKYKSLIKTLSGGQRRLVEVYVIIKAKSRFAMLDEPFSHLMPLQIDKVKELLLTEKKEKGFLITDHMYNHVADICNNIYILKDGKTILTKDMMDIETLGYARL